MNRNVIITRALTGAGDTVGKKPHVPFGRREATNEVLYRPAWHGPVVNDALSDQGANMS